ncbi:MAG: DUF1320 domain-containing protein [Burkholderiales bacterium]|jgi:phage gp36-like protein|nr:DUF1320 domain-containing protein [Burkholderiales bacterium]
MTYCTRDDLIQAFGEHELIKLTDHARTGAIDDAVLDRAIADAEGEIDGYISKRYGQTLAGVNLPNLTRIACDITRYRLYDDATIDTVRQRYEDAIVFLKDVAAGRASLGNAEIDGVGSFRVLATSADRRFNQDALRDY